MFAGEHVQGGLVQEAVVLGPFTHDAYTVGWICALPNEFVAARKMFDEEHKNLPVGPNDPNKYSLGSIGRHNVVLACSTSQGGMRSTASVAMEMMRTFPAIRFGLTVGIGGGVPSAEADIRLGDVVVSQPKGGHGGCIQYDLGKNGKVERTGFLNIPPPQIVSAVAALRANYHRSRSNLLAHVAEVENLPEFSRPSPDEDVLYEADYHHEGGFNCASCDDAKKLPRVDRSTSAVEVHFGTIASGNQLLRDGSTRDSISSDLGGVLCFEKEAAGLMNSFPCLLIRGIYDYADSHGNKSWLRYAAATAAAFAKELLSEIPMAEVPKIQSLGRSTQRCYYLPWERGKHFVGRTTELEVLEQKLFQVQDCKKIAICGLGGVGKTQVALEFAYSVLFRHQEHSVFWTPAGNMQEFEHACQKIAEVLGTFPTDSKDDCKQLIKRHLSQKVAGRWLLIVDNVDDMDSLQGTRYSEGLLECLPESSSGLTVFTTRDDKIAWSIKGIDIIPLEGMDKEEAFNLFATSLMGQDMLYDDAEITELLAELDHLPLAITQAAATINMSKFPVADYTKRLRGTEQVLVATTGAEIRDKSRYRQTDNAVTATWIKSFNEIAESDNVAAGLLKYVSCIGGKAIPHTILPTVHPETRMTSAIGLLRSFSFLAKRRHENMYDMLSPVHLAIRTWIVQSGSLIETQSKAMKHLATIFLTDDSADLQRCREYLPHVLRIIGDSPHEILAEKSLLCQRVGRFLLADGKISEAVIWLKDSCPWLHQLGEEHPDRLASQHTLAEAYLVQGQVKEAIRLLEHIDFIKREVLGEDHPNRLASQRALAGAYEANGQIQQAIVLLEHVVTIERRVLGEDYPTQLASQLAGAYKANGQIQQAIELLEHNVRIEKKVLGEDHPNRLASQRALAGAYEANGQIQQATELLEHVVRIEKKTLGKDHPTRPALQRALVEARHMNLD